MANKYTIYKSSTAGELGDVVTEVILSAGETFPTTIPVTTHGKHYYRITESNEHGESEPSAIIEGVSVAPATTLNIQNGIKRVTINGVMPIGADTCIIQADTGTDNWVTQYSGATASYVITDNAKLYTKWRYRGAFSTRSTGDLSNVFEYVNPMTVAPVLAMVDNQDGTLTFTYTGDANALEVNLMRQSTGKVETFNLDSKTITINALEVDATYYAEAICGLKTLQSNTIFVNSKLPVRSLEVAIHPITQSSIVVSWLAPLNSTYTGTRISWTSPSGATGTYDVPKASLEYNIPIDEAGVWQINARAIYAAGASTAAAEQITTTLHSVSNLVVTSVQDSYIHLSWTAPINTNYTNYLIRYKLESETNWTYTTSQKGSIISDVKVSTSGTYTVNIAARYGTELTPIWYPSDQNVVVTVTVSPWSDITVFDESINWKTGVKLPDNRVLLFTDTGSYSIYTPATRVFSPLIPPKGDAATNLTSVLNVEYISGTKVLFTWVKNTYYTASIIDYTSDSWLDIHYPESEHCSVIVDKQNSNYLHGLCIIPKGSPSYFKGIWSIRYYLENNTWFPTTTQVEELGGNFLSTVLTQNGSNGYYTRGSNLIIRYSPISSTKAYITPPTSHFLTDVIGTTSMMSKLNTTSVFVTAGRNNENGGFSSIFLYNGDAFGSLVLSISDIFVELDVKKLNHMFTNNDTNYVLANTYLMSFDSTWTVKDVSSKGDKAWNYGILIDNHSILIIGDGGQVVTYTINADTTGVFPFSMSMLLAGGDQSPMASTKIIPNLRLKRGQYYKLTLDDVQYDSMYVTGQVDNNLYTDVICFAISSMFGYQYDITGTPIGIGEGFDVAADGQMNWNPMSETLSFAIGNTISAGFWNHNSDGVGITLPILNTNSSEYPWYYFNDSVSLSGSIEVLDTNPLGDFTLTVVKNGNNAQLSWTAAANAQWYEVYRDGVYYTRVNAGVRSMNISQTTNTTFYVKAIISKLTKNSNVVNYYYVINTWLNPWHSSADNYIVPNGFTKCTATLRITSSMQMADGYISISHNGTIMRDLSFTYGESDSSVTETFNVVSGDILRFNDSMSGDYSSSIQIVLL